MVTNDTSNNQSTQSAFPAGVLVQNFEPSELIQGESVELFYGHNKARIDDSGRLLVDIGGTAEITVAMDSSSVDGGGDNVQMKALSGSDMKAVACNSSGHLLTAVGTASTQDVNIVGGVTLAVALDSSTADLGGDNVQLRAYDGANMQSVSCNSSGHLLTAVGTASTQDVNVVSERQLSQMNVGVFNATVASSTFDLDTGSNQEFIIRNRSSNDVYVLAATGASTVSTSSGVLLTSGQSFSTYGKSAFTVAVAITASGTADVEVTAVGY